MLRIAAPRNHRTAGGASVLAMLARVGLDPGPPAARTWTPMPVGDPCRRVNRRVTPWWRCPGPKRLLPPGTAGFRIFPEREQVIRYDTSFLTRRRPDPIFS